MTAAQIYLSLLGLAAALLIHAGRSRRTGTRIAAVLAVLTVIALDAVVVSAPARGASEPAAQSIPGETKREAATAPVADGVMASAAEPVGQSLGQWLGSIFSWRPADRGTAITRLHEFRDCDTCPEMVRIPAGTRAIGAGDNELLAEAAERPLRELRIWPGFAVSRREITLGELKAAGIAVDPRGTCPMVQRTPSSAATCITAEEAARYVAWLTQSTGRPYRLVSAAEWEFAARASVAPDLGAERMGGGVAELTADCWPATVEATQIRSVALDTTEITGCSHRVVKDGADSEDAHWWRPSARRAFKADGRSPRIGFRVMRPFDMTAKTGY